MGLLGLAFRGGTRPLRHSRTPMRSRAAATAAVCLLAAATSLTAAAQPIASAADCAALFNFAQDQVPVAKTADGQTVLASVQWGYSADHNLCYLVLDDNALDTLRANADSITATAPAHDPAAAFRCWKAYNPQRGFAAEPVPVAKTADGQKVLASVQWGYSADHNLCYLVFDIQAITVLRTAATASDGQQNLGRAELYDPIRPPMAPAYMDWRWPDEQPYFREVVTEFTIHNDIGNWSDKYGHYLILIQNDISDAGFYFGLQTDAQGRGKAVIFSRWGTRDLANARYSVADGWTESAGHEGGFIGVRRLYPWSAGDYQIRIGPDGLDSDGEWFGLWITDLATNTTTWIGSLKFPLLNGTAVIQPHSSATIELYGGYEPIRPIDIPQWHVSVKRPWGDDVQSTWGFTNYPWDDSENALFNSDVWYEPSEDAAHLLVGGTTERRTPAQRIDFSTAQR